MQLHRALGVTRGLKFVRWAVMVPQLHGDTSGVRWLVPGFSNRSVEDKVRGVTVKCD